MKKLNLRTKIAGGFLIVLILLCGVAVIGYGSIAGVIDCAGKAEDANRIARLILEARRHEKNFIIRGDKSYVRKVDEAVRDLLAQAKVTKTKFSEKSGQNSMDAVMANVADYHKAFTRYVELVSQKDEVLTELNSRAAKAADLGEGIRAAQKSQLLTALAAGEDAAALKGRVSLADDAGRLLDWLLDARENEKEYLLSLGAAKWKEAIGDKLGKMRALAGEMKGRLTQQADVQKIDLLLGDIAGYQKAFEQLGALIDQQKAADDAMVKTARDVSDICGAAVTDQSKDMERRKTLADRGVLAGTTAALVLGVLLAFFITRSITRPINRIIAGLTEGSTQLASASQQVAAASQLLAEGASEQAASIEETSSALEEMSSMTQHNSGNAQQANTLMKEANAIVNEANVSMGELTSSMEAISKASEETSKIIKTIDEIAFQTNLLALNAAVEAARAGEAGAGFAVVADEVRNLAMRAASAAKNTADMIEGTVKKVKGGTDLVMKTSQAFNSVARSTSKVGELLGEIAVASQEQFEGIEQVNKAVAQMDKVIQQNAASAEESASASEELNSQAVQMHGYVGGLVSLVTGSNKKGGDTAEPPAKVAMSERNRPQKPLYGRQPIAKGGPKRIAHQKSQVRPDQVIPMEDDDFCDF